MEYFLNLVESYGLIIIFIILILEYACFPIPSEVVLPLAGAIGYLNKIPFLIMLVLSVICGLIGSFFCYYLGYFGKNKIIDRFFKRNENEVKESFSLYNKYSNVATLVGRLIPICRTYISFIAGARKHKFTSYFISTTIGITIWNGILIYLGYVFYNNLNEIGPLYTQYKNIILICCSIILISYIIYKIVKHIKTKRRKIALSSF